MPIPFIIGAAAVIAGATGFGAGIYGAKKMYDANETIDSANYIRDRSIELFEENKKATDTKMDEVGKYELNILKSFTSFADLIESIQNRPDFKNINVGYGDLPKYNPDELKEISVGATVTLSGLAGAALGSAGGIAAAGATYAAVMAFGTASTGTAISSLGGVAATNAALAALGGGSLAAGGGGVALGTTLLGAATAGVGLLIGGAIFAFSGLNLSDKADEAYAQARRIRLEAEKACGILAEIYNTAEGFYNSLRYVNDAYTKRMEILTDVVYYQGKRNWNDFTDRQKLITKNTVLLVGLLYKMCKVNLLTKDPHDEKSFIANSDEVTDIRKEAKQVMDNIASV